MSLGNEKYLLLTTFRRNGTPVPSPVWIVDMGDGTLAFWTSSGSGKAKRLSHTTKVTLQPCDARGRLKPGSSPAVGSAQLVTGSELDRIGQKIRAKYGFATKITKVLGLVGGILKRKRIPYGDRGVVITLAK